MLREDSDQTENWSNNEDNISLIKFAQKQAFDQSLEIENEHSSSKNLIPSENEKEIDEESVSSAGFIKNNCSSVEKIKTSTYFANIRKSNTKETEVIREDILEYNSFMKNQMTFVTNQSVSVSRINTVDRDNIFYNNPNWLLSNRLINDEKNYLNRQATMTIPNYKFLDQIREDSRKAVAMRTKNFISLNDDAMYNLLAFIYDHYKVITKINKYLERKICLTMNNKFENVINSFREKYREIFELHEFYFHHSEVKRLNSNSSSEGTN